MKPRFPSVSGHPGILAFLLFTIVLSASAFAAKPAKPTKAPQGFLPPAPVRRSLNAAQARNFLQQAKTARMAGNATEADRLWMQARSLDPALQRPAWLDQEVRTVKPVDGIPPVQALLSKAETLEYRDAAPLLEDWLRRFPDDAEVRRYSLARAKAARDPAQTRRHQAILEPEAARESTPWWKVLVAVLFGTLLVREAVVFIREWRRGRS